MNCPDCGHEHQGERFAGICIGCPCAWRPPGICDHDFPEATHNGQRMACAKCGVVGYAVNVRPKKGG